MPTTFNVPVGKSPLADYPWCGEVERLLDWVKTKNVDYQCFLFDLVMPLSFVDATSDLAGSIEYCPNTPAPYNLHLGFINLCSPCYESVNTWTFQKAAKPQSGALGKLSSEVILKFIEKISTNLTSVQSIGGANSIDAVLKHVSGEIILAEVKSAPLITYPVLFCDHSREITGFHDNPNLTNTQFSELDSALYLHDTSVLPLGKPKDTLWPFKGAVDYITNPAHLSEVSNAVKIWLRAKQAYVDKDKSNAMYYLANASGCPPKVAKEKDNWPRKMSISDSKTSAGMDRTDDIKKGIYQSVKIGALLKRAKDPDSCKTAIISNLPAYRHGEEYVDPFIDIVWGLEGEMECSSGLYYLSKNNLRYLFDYLITIENPVLRGLDL